ncbi:MAG: SpoIIE family protein phosphatase [Thermoflexales bacterium]|nr:SpoIIE family protein phosphatase [Thermoflexales bacterium]
MRLINLFLDVPSTDPDDARRRKLLNILLAGVAAGAIMMVLASIALVLSGVSSLEEGSWVYPSVLALLGGGVLVFAINRFRSGVWASWLFVLLVTLVILFTDEPRQVVAGRSLFLLTIPIMIASVLLRPHSSFIATGLIGLLLIAFGLYAGVDDRSSLPFTIIGFLVVATVSWLATHSTEQTLQDLRALNQELDRRVLDRTLELAEANDQLIEANLQLFETNEQLAASYQREQERLRLSDTLREVATFVGSSLEPQGVVELMLSQLGKVVTYHYATVRALAGHELELVGGWNAGECVSQEPSAPVNKYPLNAAALRERQPLLVPDVRDDERWCPTPTTGAIRSFINAPLLVQGAPTGLLSVGRTDETPYTEQDAQVVFAFANQVAVALENARLHEYELDQVERELEIARRIQVSLLPSESPTLDGLDIAGYSQPARQVGGDFYNYFVFGEGQQVGLAVGDTSGKGMESALMMALSFGLLANQALSDVSPPALLAELNKEILPHTRRSGLNTALCYTLLERLASPPDGGAWWQVQAANAGLLSPLICNPAGMVEWVDLKGLPLGASEDSLYEVWEGSLAPGSALILSSDGLVEAKNVLGDMYGFDRLVEHVTAKPPGRFAARELLEWILAGVCAFMGDAEMYDDLTLIVAVVG